MAYASRYGWFFFFFFGKIQALACQMKGMHFKIQTLKKKTRPYEWLHFKKCQHQCSIFQNFNSCIVMMQKVFHEEAATVVFTHAALQYLERKDMGEMRTVYHDWLQMSFCGQCTLLWKWFGQWKKEEKYNKDKKGKWESLLVFLAPRPWSVIGVMEIDLLVNCLLCLIVLGSQ